MLRFIHSSVPMGLGYEEISVVPDDFGGEELDELVVLVINSLASSGVLHVLHFEKPLVLLMVMILLLLPLQPTTNQIRNRLTSLLSP